MPNNSLEATPTAAEIFPIAAIVAAAQSLPTPTTIDILPTAAEATIATARSFPRIQKRLIWMKDYKVTGIEDPISHFNSLFFSRL